MALVAVGGTGYWYLWSERAETTAPPADSVRVPLTSDRPESQPIDDGPYADAPELGNAPESSDTGLKQDPERGQALLASGRKAAGQGQAVAARAQLTEAMEYDLPLEEKVRLRADLTQLARQTILSNAILENDPFVEAYVVQPGDALGKIAKTYKVTDEFLARINGITDKNRIHVGQRLKVVKGPFDAVVTKADYTLDVYLHGTFIQRYPVGVGAESSTPSGKWKVLNKLVNPQYYPPRGGKFILADDPKNPLGERWIGLQGIEGQALGQERYGLHGTIEPESIGQSASMGCIRMHNSDVEELYDLLVVEHSQVTVK